MSPSAEAEILAFLREQREADLTGTLRKLADLYVAHELKDTERHAEVLGTLKGHSLRIGELEKDTGKLERGLDDTGRYRMEQLHESSRWGKRFIISTMVAIVIAIVSATVGVIATLFTRK